ncbi:MAG: molybdate ABC transporter permease subunit [Chloroflexi bacterium]|nr:molybdate ABC transporter permease subunit [Chloroflexota bacterium]
MRAAGAAGGNGQRLGAGWLAVGVAPTVLFLLFVGLPLVALLVRGFGHDNFWASLTSETVLQALRLSLITSAITVGIVALVGTPMAYFLARRQFPGRQLIDGLIELPIVLPPVVAGLAMLMAFGRNSVIGEALTSIGVELPFTMTAVVFAQLFVGAPFFLRSAKLGFEAVDPALEEIAQTLGASPVRTFFRVSLPLASRALAGGLVLCWARAVAEFGATIMFAGNLPGRTQTMPVAILGALESDLGEALALSVVLVVMAVAVLLGVRVAIQRGLGHVL